MTKEPYEEGLEILRDSEADEDFRANPEVASAYRTEGQLGTYGASGSGGAAGKAKDVAGSAASKAGDVAGSAAEKASELKDVAVERGGEVAAVAKDELARLAGEARSEVQSLLSNATGQLRSQAATGQQQLSEMLHSLAGELGEMASKSENSGPLTALAKQAAAKGGEWSHWLANSEPADALAELRRFARRRPFVFLASAAAAGLVIGRLGRGLMAANDTERTSSTGVGTSLSSSGRTEITPSSTVTYDKLPSFGTEEAPELQGYPSQASSTNPYGLDAGGAR